MSSEINTTTYNNYNKNYQNSETILWGVKVDNPDYMEEVLFSCRGYVNKEELKAKGEEWARSNGYNRLRIAIINLREKPNFVKSLSK